LFQTRDVVYGEGKLRDLGMVFKPGFKCLKNKKINFSPAILKLETLLCQNMYTYYFIFYYIRRAILIQKKKWPKRKKNMPNGMFFFLLDLFLDLFESKWLFEYKIR